MTRAARILASEGLTGQIDGVKMGGMRLAVLVLAAGCSSNPSYSGATDLGGLDIAMPDLEVPGDLSAPRDLSTSRDLTARDLVSPADLRAADLIAPRDLVPASDLVPPADMVAPADLIPMCIARGDSCSSATECCESGGGCATFALVGKRCCGGLGATGCDYVNTGDPCCALVPSGAWKDVAQGCYPVPTGSGSAPQCCIRYITGDASCGSGQRKEYRCSDSGALINGGCL
jgi:hypothetical protein